MAVCDGEESGGEGEEEALIERDESMVLEEHDTPKRL